MAEKGEEKEEEKKGEAKVPPSSAGTDRSQQSEEAPELSSLKAILARMSPLALEILQVIRRQPGISRVRIAEYLGVHRDTVAKHMDTEDFGKAKAELTLSALELLNRYVPDAVRKLGSQLNRKDDRISQGAAKGLLQYSIGTVIRTDTPGAASLPALQAGLSEVDGDLLIEGFRDRLRAKKKS